MTRNENAKFDPNAIPAELKERAQWVLWRYETKPEGDKRSKIPYQANFKRASSKNPNTWSTFAKVLEAWQVSPNWFNGVGFVFTESDPFWGIDFDNCLANDGSLLEWAREGVEILREAGAYIEVSPSGQGLKAFIRCTQQSQDGRKRAIENQPGSAIEVYSHGRYFTVTGQPFGDQPGALGDATEALGRFSSWVDTITKPAPQTPAKVLQGEGVSSTPAPQTWSTTGRPDAHERARLYANTIPPAISGQNGHGVTFRLACVLVTGFGLGIDGARPILEEWNQRCQPPWSTQELEHKLNEAEKKSEIEWESILRNDRSDAPDVNLSGLVESIQTIQLAVAIPRDESHLPSNWDEITHVDQALLDQMKRNVHRFSDMIAGYKIAQEQLKNQARPALKLKPVELPGPPEGFLRDFTRWQLETATRPQPAFALFGSITLLSTLIGRKVKLGDGHQTRPVVYGLMLGGTARGKDHALSRISDFMAATGIAEKIVTGAATSDSSLYNAHKGATCARLWLADEFGQYFKSNRNDSTQHVANVNRALLEMFSARNKPQFQGKEYADAKNNYVLRYPHQNLYAVSTPGVILENLRPSDVESGLVGRLLIVGGDDKQKSRKTKYIPPPDDLLAIAKNWYAFQPGAGNLSGFSGGGETVVPITPEAQLLMDWFVDVCDERLEMDEKTGALWGRAAEKASQLALISACSRITDPARDHTEVTDADYLWAMETVTEVTEWTCRLVDDSISENNQEATVKRVLKIIREAGSEGILRSDLSKSTKGIKQPERDSIIKDLKAMGYITEAVSQGARGAPAGRFFAS